LGAGLNAESTEFEDCNCEGAALPDGLAEEVTRAPSLISGLLSLVFFDVSTSVIPSFPFSSPSNGPSKSDSSLRGVEALEALSTSVVLSFGWPSSFECSSFDDSPLGSGAVEKAGDVVSGGGVNEEVGEETSAGLVGGGSCD